MYNTLTKQLKGFEMTGINKDIIDNAIVRVFLLEVKENINNIKEFNGDEMVVIKNFISNPSLGSKCPHRIAEQKEIKRFLGLDLFNEIQSIIKRIKIKSNYFKYTNGCYGESKRWVLSTN